MTHTDARPGLPSQQPAADLAPRLPARPCAQLRLSTEQFEERRAAEAAIKDVEEEIEVEEDADKRVTLTAELQSRKDKLDALLDGFEARRAAAAAALHCTAEALARSPADSRPDHPAH